MSRYTKDKKKEHIALVRQLMIRNPEATGWQMQNFLADKGYKFSVDYVYNLMKKINGERAARYDRKTKSILVAQYDDMIQDLEPRLRKIANNNFDYKAAVSAIKQLAENRKQLIDILMDLGLLERNLGKLDIHNYDMAALSKAVEDANNQRKRDNTVIDEQ